VKLSIRNFEIIESAELDLSGVTMIIGNSNNGKSSIVRAIDALLFGADGEEYITYGKPECTITAEGLGGHSISRTRKRNGSTSYTVNGKTHTKLNKLGHLEVLRPCGIVRLEAGGDTFNLNIVNQFDPLFFVGMGPTQAFDIIQIIIGENRLPDVLDDVSTLIRGYNKQIAITDALIEDGRVAVNQTATKLDRLASARAGAEPAAAELTAAAARYTAADVALSRVVRCRETALFANARVTKLSSADLSGVDVVGKAIDRLQQARKSVNDIARRVGAADRLNRDVQRLSSADLSGVATAGEAIRQHAHAVSALSTVRNACARATSTAAKVAKLASVDLSAVDRLTETLNRYAIVRNAAVAIRRAHSVQDTRRDEVDSVAHALTEHVDVVARTRAMLTTCPHCSSVLTESTKQHLLQHEVNK
jgi:energy-coupling factor transporter ATP-binding protein EcfA2